MLMDNGSRRGCCRGCWRWAWWHGWPVLGESKPSMGLGPRQDGEGAQDPCASAHQTHVPALYPRLLWDTPAAAGALPCGGSGFTTQKQPVPPGAGEGGGASRLLPSHRHQLRGQPSEAFPSAARMNWPMSAFPSKTFARKPGVSPRAAVHRFFPSHPCLG